MKRPRSVTVIAWLTILSALLALAGVWAVQYNPIVAAEAALRPVPLSVQMPFVLLASCLMVASGSFMLRGANWARMLYIWWSPLGLVMTLLNFGLSPVFFGGVLKVGVEVFFLTRRKSVLFFQGNNNPRPHSEGRS
jgi:hypothetical protein